MIHGIYFCPISSWDDAKTPVVVAASQDLFDLPYNTIDVLGTIYATTEAARVK